MPTHALPTRAGGGGHSTLLWPRLRLLVHAPAAATCRRPRWRPCPARAAREASGSPVFVVPSFARSRCAAGWPWRGLRLRGICPRLAAVHNAFRPGPGWSGHAAPAEVASCIQGGAGLNCEGEGQLASSHPALSAPSMPAVRTGAGREAGSSLRRVKACATRLWLPQHSSRRPSPLALRPMLSVPPPWAQSFGVPSSNPLLPLPTKRAQLARLPKPVEATKRAQLCRATTSTPPTRCCFWPRGASSPWLWLGSPLSAPTAANRRCPSHDATPW